MEMALIPTMPKVPDNLQYSEVEKEWGTERGYKLRECGV
jgi:hypothetical protein